MKKAKCAITPGLNNGRLHWQCYSKIDLLRPIWYPTNALICYLIKSAMALKETKNA